MKTIYKGSKLNKNIKYIIYYTFHTEFNITLNIKKTKRANKIASSVIFCS